MYTGNEKSTGLDVLTSLQQTDLYIVGDVADNGRAKAITQADMEITIALSNNFINTLVSNTYFVDTLVADNYFITTLANDTTFLTEITNNATFQTLVNNFVSGGGSGGGGTKLAIDTNEVTHTGNTTETTLFTIPIPAGTLSTNNAIRFSFYGTLQDPGLITYRVKYGGTTIATIANDPQSNGVPYPFVLSGKLIADNATNAQKASSELFLKIAANTNYEGNQSNGTAAVDSTISQNLVVTVELADPTATTTVEAIVVEEISTGLGVISSYTTKPVAPTTGATGTTQLQLDTNTRMYVSMINIPQKITVADLTFAIANHSVNGTFSFVLYSEDGQTQILTGTSATITANNFYTTSITPVTVSAGNYYLGVHSNAASNFNARNIIMENVNIIPTGGSVLVGQVTITASTTPATIDPAVDISFDQAGCVLARFDA